MIENSDHFRSVSSTRDAMAYLMTSWPTKGGKSFSAARGACLGRSTGRSTARQLSSPSFARPRKPAERAGKYKLVASRWEAAQLLTACRPRRRGRISRRCIACRDAIHGNDPVASGASRRAPSSCEASPLMARYDRRGRDVDKRIKQHGSFASDIRRPEGAK
nr:DUF982 domain-containing protein [Rhizobium bangladeshense]